MVKWGWVKQNSYDLNIVIICCSLLVGILSGVTITNHVHNSGQIEKNHTYIEHFSSLLTEKRIARALGAVAKLAAQPKLIETVAGELPPDNPEALLVLEHAKFLCDTALIYLLNSAGDIVAGTTYGGGKTLTGKNYSFRPYFIEPMRTGNSYSYPALGITTGERGLYFSAPVQVDGENIGVVVIKIALSFIDEELNKLPYPCAMLTKDGIVFATNRPDWLFKAALPLSSDKRSKLVASKQFADEVLSELPINLYQSGKKISFENKTVIPTVSPINFHAFSYVFLFPQLSPPRTLLINVCLVTTVSIWVLLSIGVTFFDRRRLFESLKAREKDYRSIIDNLRATFYRVDNQDRFIQVSPAMVDMYQPVDCRDREMIGCSADKIWPDPESQRVFLKKMEDNNGKIKDFACQLMKSDGSVAPVVINASYFFDEKGAKQGIEGLIYDVSDIMELQQQLLLLDSAMQVASNGITITDVEGKMIWINHAFTKMTGYEADEAIGQNTSILKSGNHEDEFYAGIWQTITSGNVWYGELSNKRKDGTIYFEEMTITPVFDDDGTITNFIAIKSDIGARRQHEDEKEEMLVREQRLSQRLAEEKIKNNETEIVDTRNKFPNLSGIQILLITDNSFEQLLLIELLQKQKGSVFSVKNGLDAVSALTSNNYNLILLDYAVADMCDEINLSANNCDNNHPAILLMTAARNGELHPDKKINGIIHKPLDPPQFFAEINRCLAMDEVADFVPVPVGIILDRETGLKRVMGDEKTYARLLQSFKGEFNDSVTAMVKVLTTGKVNELKMLVHTLKGASGGIGGDILHQHCAEVEKLLLTTVDNNRLVAQFDVLAGHLDDLLNEIGTHVAADTLSINNLAGNKKIAQQLFQEYGSAIETGKFKGGQQLAIELGRYNWSDCFLTEIEQLQQLLDDYSFDRATILLRSLEQKMLKG